MRSGPPDPGLPHYYRVQPACYRMLAVWGRDPVEYHGKHFNLEPAYIGPKPGAEASPAGHCRRLVPKALDRAGRLAAPVDALISMMKRGQNAAKERGRMRCLVNRTDQRLDDATRAVTHGTWEQITADVRKMEDAGVGEVFFDVAFQKDAQSRDGLRSYMERFLDVARSGAAV